MEHEVQPQYPSTNLAYKFAVDSYEWAVKRLDSMDSRIQTIIGVGVSVTLAAPVAFSALQLKGDRRWFMAAFSFFFLAIIIGTYSRMKGTLTIITPKTLHEKWLHLEEPEFKRTLIYFAGEHLEKNSRLIYKKHQLAVVVTVMFGLEVACWVAAVVFSPVLGQP